MTDPIADMLARVRNAVMARKKNVRMPSSKLKQSIANIMKDEGFIEDYQTVDDDIQPHLNMVLRYMDNRSAITGLKRISRPGCRSYVGKADIPRVRGGQGVSILTTSKGVVSDRTARSLSVGGEVLCEIW